jgi:hypothetical protein
MKSLAKISLVLLAALTLTALTTNAQTSSPAASTNAPAAKPTLKRYAGKIASFDKDANILKVTLASGDSQSIHIVAKTKVRKDGQVTTLTADAVGEKVRGSMHKDDSGDWVANTVVIGEPKKPAAAPAQ